MTFNTPASKTGDSGGGSGRSSPSRVRSSRKVGSFCSISDSLTEFLIYGTVVFSPWAFGTTATWSIWTVNIALYALGLILVFKKSALRFSGIAPPRWDCDNCVSKGTGGWIPVLLAIDALLLAYILVGALNNRANYDDSRRVFTYRESISWLPHSYDRHSSLEVFWRVLALSCLFWAARDWLLGRGESDIRRGTQVPMPGRLRRLCWVLSVNGALLAVEGIIQRLEGSGRVLFLVRPYWDRELIMQFGPWAYRANAAQYFNLVWPMAIGFWLWLAASPGGQSRPARVGSDPRAILLPLALLMAACPIISSSRGGAIIAVVQFVVTILIISGFRRRGSSILKFGVPLALCGGFGLGVYFGWETLGPRLTALMHGDTSYRNELYANSRHMAREFLVFGSGAGTFGPLYQLYRTDPEQWWEDHAHNDWLEGVITLGAVGEALMVAGFVIVVVRSFRRGGIPVPRGFHVFVLLALSGCLMHATIDFPLQVYSISFLFTLAFAVLASIGGGGNAPALRAGAGSVD